MTIYIYNSLKNPARLCKPHLSSSIFLFFFSSGPRKSKAAVAVADYLVNRHQFSPETALKVSSVATYLRKPEKSDSILSYLKESGFSQTHLEEIVKRRPNVLSANLENTIKPKIKTFQELGFSPTDMAEIMSFNPWILTRSAENRLRPSILVLESILDSKAGVVKLLKFFAWFLEYDLEKTMMPNIEFMKSCGISATQITRAVFNFPRLFLCKPESIKDIVRRVDEMGFDRKSKMLLYAIRAMSSMTMENWELKLQLFRDLGFSEGDILSMFKRAPMVFALSDKKLTGATKLLLGSGKLDISSVVKNPELLIYGIENRLKPRLRVLENLERKNLLPEKISLLTVYKMADGPFFKKYVLPYSKELKESYIPNGGPVS